MIVMSSFLDSSLSREDEHSTSELTGAHEPYIYIPNSYSYPKNSSYHCQPPHMVFDDRMISPWPLGFGSGSGEDGSYP